MLSRYERSIVRDKGTDPDASPAQKRALQLLEDLETCERLLFQLAEQFGALLAIHEAIVMDTEDDRAIHDRVVKTFKELLGIVDDKKETTPGVHEQ